MNDDDLSHIVSDIEGKPHNQAMANQKPEADPLYVEDEQSPFGSAVETGNHPNTEDMVKAVTGEDPVPGKPFHIGDEVNQDEEDLLGGSFSTQDVDESLIQAPGPDKPQSPEQAADPVMDGDKSPPDDKQ